MRSLAAQQGGHDVAVIVVENEGTEQAGAQRAASLMEQGLFKGFVIVEPRQGNCKAYNGRLALRADALPGAAAVLGIDDDERSDAAWLDAFLKAARSAPRSSSAVP